jgi:hypothetical protein
LKPYRGPPMTLGNAAAAHVYIIVWCLDCRHKVEPDPAEMVARYGAERASQNLRGLNGRSPDIGTSGRTDGEFAGGPLRNPKRLLSRFCKPTYW